MADQDQGYILHADEPEKLHRAPTPPSRTSSALAAAASRRSRRNSVQIACERCRRRKIRCSGLPGPCTSCARLSVACHDPGKRKDRSQSLLEDRIQRLEALTLANEAMRRESAGELLHTNTVSITPTIAHPQPRQTLLLQTTNLDGYSQRFADDFNQPSSLSMQGIDHWIMPTSPACYSDQGPDMDSMWNSSEIFQPYMEEISTPIPSIHKRSHTFPVIKAEGVWKDEMPTSAGGFSDIPSIEITSHDSSRPQTPHVHPPQSMSPAGFSIPYQSDFLDQDDNLDDIGFESPQPFAFSAMNTRNMEDTLPIEYYGEHLSPLDQPPPPLSRKSSMTSSAERGVAGLYETTDSMSPYPQSVSSRTRMNRSQTLPTSTAQDRDTQHNINLIVSSPRTRNHIQAYFQGVHPDYPFLDPYTFTTNRSLAYRASGLQSDNGHRRTTIPDAMSSYQTLLVAAIGAMVHHQSRSLSSRHLRLAMTLHPQIDMWSSVSGLHCAMLLSIYLLLEQTISFDDEDENHPGDDLDMQKPHLSEPPHPPVNLWLHNCQVAAASIDLGLHRSLSDDEDDDDMNAGAGPGKHMVALCTNTFRVAYKLDKRISNLRNRPRAFHDTDLDPSLIVGL